MFDFSRNKDDHEFILSEYIRLNSIYINKIYLHNYDDNEEILNIPRKKTNWSPFYKKISKWNNKDIVIKCDDDILFIDIFSLKKAIIDRINDKTSFLIHSNCINNGVCTYFQNNIFLKLKEQINKYPKGGILGILFEKPEIAYAIHTQFCNDIILNLMNLNKYVIDDVYINSRISINFILINGCDLKYLDEITIDDEYELSSLIPEKLCRPNKIKGDLITSHLSYTFQEKIILNRDIILNLYDKIKSIYIKNNKNIINNDNIYLKNNILIPKSHINNEIFKVKSWFHDNHYYIRNVETNKYLFIDYEIDEFKLSDKDRTIFEIFEKNNSIEIKLGIYSLTRYNCIGKFRNESIFMKYFRDETEKELIKEDDDNKNGFYLKFSKYDNYFSINNKSNSEEIIVSLKKNNKWIFEKIKNKNEFIEVSRFLKNKKFYYKNIKNNEIYTNYYLGWGLENILW